MSTPCRVQKRSESGRGWGLGESGRFVRNVVVEEVAWLDGEVGRIVIGGISQGCAMAAHVLLSLGLGRMGMASDAALGGLVGWCSWMSFSGGMSAAAQSEDRTAALDEFDEEVLGLHLDETASSEAWSVRTEIPLLLSHNTDNDVLEFELGKGLRDSFANMGRLQGIRNGGALGQQAAEPRGSCRLPAGERDSVGGRVRWGIRDMITGSMIESKLKRTNRSHHHSIQAGQRVPSALEGACCSQQIPCHTSLA